MEGQKCSPFGRRERKSKSKFDASQFNDQPANLWIQAIAPKLPKTKEVPKISSRIQSDSGGAESEEEPPRGTGTVLAVLDTGIQRDHRAFSNSEVTFDDKVLQCKKFVDPDDEDCEDYFGHGTECAGLACGLSFKGLDEDGKPEFNSPAPGAKLMVCKIGNYDSDEGLLEAIIAALKFIIEFNSEDENKDKKVDVVSISLGFNSFNKDLALAIQEAVSKDIIVVCCASNDGANFSNPITYPGRLGHVLCIGACDNNGQPAKFSSEGREVDFVELGTDVWVPTISREIIHRDNKMVVQSGTSYSTPSVAGLICVLLQDLKRLSTDRNQLLLEDMHNVWCMRELLKSMCVMQGHHDNAKGYGKLNPKEYFKKGDEERIRICNEILGK